MTDTQLQLLLVFRSVTRELKGLNPSSGIFFLYISFSNWYDFVWFDEKLYFMRSYPDIVCAIYVFRLLLLCFDEKSRIWWLNIFFFRFLQINCYIFVIQLQLYHIHDFIHIFLHLKKYKIIIIIVNLMYIICFVMHMISICRYYALFVFHIYLFSYTYLLGIFSDLIKFSERKITFLETFFTTLSMT